MLARLRLLLPILALFGMLFTISGVSAAGGGSLLQGRVIGVADGDTLTLLTAAHQNIKLRLAEIDAPEGGQPWGQMSKSMLSELVFGKDVSIQITDHDRYGRSVARVHVGSVDVNLEMVKRGGAWAYEQYLTDASIMDAEAQARVARRGLWSMPASQIVPPWEFRRNKREAAAGTVFTPRTLMSSASTVSCGAKRYCKQMSSCTEAKAYLRQCGVASLDGDGDGVPCDTICRGR